MSMPRTQFVVTLTVLVSMLFTLAPAPIYVEAASHREAPLIAMDPTADITDFFMFRSYESGNEDKIVFIMNVIPGEEPGFGPNYYNFDPHVLYKIDIDNDADGDADDVSFEFRFETEIRGTVDELDLFLGYLALPGPITALDGVGSEGLGLRQKYNVVMKRNDTHYKELGEDLIVVPSNVGPRTMPDYESLAQQGVYDIDDGVRVFAGQRQDPFYIDVGAIFDTLNLRRTPPLLSLVEDAQEDSNPFGVDMLSGFNVHTIAIEVPASLLTMDNLGPEETSHPQLGAFASTSRQRVRVLATRVAGVQAASAGNETSFAEDAELNQALDEALDEVLSDEEAVEETSNDPEGGQASGAYQTYLPLGRGSDGAQASTVDASDDVEASTSSEESPCRIGARNLICNRGKNIQVQRLANPLVNETIIPTELKDFWGSLDPISEHQFIEYFLNPRLAVTLETVYGVPAATSNREDLVALLLKYPSGGGTLADLLRLDISVPPTPLADQKRLGPFAIDASGNSTPDPAAWPNGRRPKDDVTDIAVRTVGGPNYIEGRAGDGVNTDDATLLEGFPFLATPSDGLNHVHIHSDDNNP
jgi:hypothetical protein